MAQAPGVTCGCHGHGAWRPLQRAARVVAEQNPADRALSRHPDDQDIGPELLRDLV
jgi:hypothetical protein